MMLPEVPIIEESVFQGKLVSLSLRKSRLKDG